jgi:hypothetical protein
MLAASMCAGLGASILTTSSRSDIATKRAALCGLPIALDRRGHDHHMPKVMELRAAIALECSVVPMYVDLMDGNAADGAGLIRLVAVIADPDDAIA